MPQFLFDGWMPLLRTLVIGVLAYASLVVILRITGKRTLSKMNAFDLIVTVALGSTLASALITRDVTLAQAVTAFLVLAGLQFVLTWLSVRVSWFRDVVTGHPVMVLHRGEPIRPVMRRERITMEEVQAAIREAGLSDLGDAEAVVLETDGSMSVIRKLAARGDHEVTGVDRPRQDGEAQR